MACATCGSAAAQHIRMPSTSEGFFGRLKNEAFYGEDWSGWTIEGFMSEIDAYIRWYNERRIKLTLDGMSPVEYRESLGLMAA